jgi:hypothetical protein
MSRDTAIEIMAPESPSIEITPNTELGRELTRIIIERRPKRILETGTHKGNGSTATILRAIRQAGYAADFRSIECRPEWWAEAKENLAGQPVILYLGLSIPRDSLPSMEDIAVMCAETPDGIAMDFGPEDRAAVYHESTDTGTVDDIMGQVMVGWQGQVDLVLLDGAGHVGLREFEYLTKLARPPFILAMDDVQHLKSYKALEMVKSNQANRILAEGSERFGWAVAEIR